MPTVRAQVSAVLTNVRAELETDTAAAAGGNAMVSKSEEKTLPPGVLSDAAAKLREAGGPGTRIYADEVVDKAARRVRTLLGQVNQKSGSGKDTVSQAEVKALAAKNADAGRRVARAYELITGKKIDLGDGPTAGGSGSTTTPPPSPGPAPGTPPPSTPPPSTPPPSTPTTATVPGATGTVTFIDPARVDAIVPQIKALLPLMDLSRSGTVSLSEARAFASTANNGQLSEYRYQWPNHTARLLFEAREAAYQRTGTSQVPLAEIAAELDTIARRAKDFGADANNFAFDRNGRIDLEGEFAAVALYDLARAGTVDLEAQPWVRFYDHEGDYELGQRFPLDLGGAPEHAVRRLVFQYNAAGNDNHWPLWSNTPTSRYRIDVGEAQPIVDRIREQPLARQKELFAALVAWSASRAVGYLYIEEAARPLFEALAIELGSAARFPPGTWTAPSIGPL